MKHRLLPFSMACAALLPTVTPAQLPAPSKPPLTVGEVLACIDEERLDQGKFLALVAAGTRAVPGLVEVVCDCTGQSQLAQRRQPRALRALRLIGPTHAATAVPPLLGAVARDISRDDTELLLTIAQLAPGATDRGALLARIGEIEIEAPDGDHERFLRWVAKLRLWYDIRLRLVRASGGDLGGLIKMLDDEDPLQRRRAAEDLGRLGTVATPALDALIRCAHTQRPPRVTRVEGLGSLTADFRDLIGDATAIAIARIDPSHPEARRGLTLLLQADAPGERFAALMAMTKPSPEAGNESAFDVVPAVLAATHDDDLRIAAEAITTLVRLEDRRPEVLQRLEQLATADEAQLSARARAALRR
ncbi:MAG: hypothetical protein MUC36_08695 [Planctomycetes bacterium]|jgi:hypothetical protein|nr:hypothetical protein [Planctomycetota bacterium]